MTLTEYNGDGPSCSVDSRFGSFPPRKSEMSSVVERLKQLPIFDCLFSVVNLYTNAIRFLIMIHGFVVIVVCFGFVTFCAYQNDNVFFVKDWMRFVFTITNIAQAMIII